MKIIESELTEMADKITITYEVGDKIMVIEVLKDRNGHIGTFCSLPTNIQESEFVKEFYLKQIKD